MQHQSLASGRWQKLSLVEQMANIGSEVERTIKWRKKGNQKISLNAFYRALELIDITLKFTKNKSLLREVARVREMLVDYFVGDNQYHSKDEDWHKYFRSFTIASRSKAQS